MRSDGGAVTDCGVSVSGPAGQAWAAVGADGEFHATGLPAGRYTVNANARIGETNWHGSVADVDVVVNVTTQGVEVVLGPEGK